MSTIVDDIKSAFNRPNNAVIKIIFINIFVWLALNITHTIAFLMKMEANYLQIERWLLLPANLGEFMYQPWTLITYFFIHKDLFHILFNMLAFYWFGQIIEEFLGSRRVISLYVLGGIAGGIMFLTIYPFLPQFNIVAGANLKGASAGVFAIVVGAATLRPTYVMHLLLIGAVEIKWIAATYVILSVIFLRGGNAGGDLSHLGGALMGYIFIRQLQNGNDWGTWIHKILRWVTNIFSGNKSKKTRNANMRPSHAKQTQTSGKTNSNYSGNYSTKASNLSTNIPNQEEIDRILDKINDSGWKSLTKDELEKLEKIGKS
ncbi:MAG: rhomboid family intramembrane serine protease [Bacteroidetes bacterium]|nr:MAG: rhomboid family intramembrane serine protease [Bacteroidota bacterium]TAG95340.1 MAG: rhomboid family intramembrane serine protease [Bacteroidota bacterium]